MHTSRKPKHIKRNLKWYTNKLTFHMFVSRSTSCLPDISMASTLKTANRESQKKI